MPVEPTSAAAATNAATNIIVKLVRPVIHELKKQVWPPCAVDSGDRKLEVTLTLLYNWLPEINENARGRILNELYAAIVVQDQFDTISEERGLSVVFNGGWWANARKYRTLMRSAHKATKRASVQARLDASLRKCDSPEGVDATGPLETRSGVSVSEADSDISVQNRCTDSGTVFNNEIELPTSALGKRLNLIVKCEGAASTVNTRVSFVPQMANAGKNPASNSSPQGCSERPVAPTSHEVVHTLEDGSVLKFSEKDIGCLRELLESMSKDRRVSDEATSGGEDATISDNEDTASLGLESDGPGDQPVLVITVRPQLGALFPDEADRIDEGSCE